MGLAQLFPVSFLSEQKQAYVRHMMKKILVLARLLLFVFFVLYYLCDYAQYMLGERVVLKAFTKCIYACVSVLLPMLCPKLPRQLDFA